MDIAAYALGSLDLDELAAFEVHLASCTTCRNELVDLQATTRALRRMAPDIPLAQDLKNKTLTAIKAENRPRPTAITPRNAFRSNIARNALAIAAAVVVAFGAATMWPSHKQPSTVLEIALTSSSGGREAGMAHLRPFHGGTKLTLDLEDLPASPAGMHYECNVEATEASTMSFSAGTFRMDQPGDLQMTMMTAIPTGMSASIRITMRPDDPNTSLASTTVLTSAKT